MLLNISLNIFVIIRDMYFKQKIPFIVKLLTKTESRKCLFHEFN